MPCPVFLMWQYVISFKSEREGAHSYLTWLPCSRSVTHRILIKLQLTGKSRLISQLMNIANLFCQSPGVTSHAKTFVTVCTFWTDSRSNRLGIRLDGSGYPLQKKIVIRSNGLGYLFEKNCHLFEWLQLSIRKKLSSVWMASATRLKKLLSVRMAREKLSTVKATKTICSKINFSRVSIPKQFCC